MSFLAWPEIEAFHNVRKYTKSHPEVLGGNSLVKYKAKVKLHGTNAAVQCLADGTILAQSRTNIITPENDNAGFARWVKENEVSFKEINTYNRSGSILYGEWVGPGIQKGVAISEIPKRSFVVFAARPLDAQTNEPIKDWLWVEPEALKSMITGLPDTYVLPWFENKTYEVDWSLDSESLTKVVDGINQDVIAVETNDPWVEGVFNVKGTGEGLVFYPMTHEGIDNYKNLVFKAKGEKHKNIKTAAPAQVDAQCAASVSQFVDMVLTTARLEQGATAVAGSLTFDMKLVGKFIAWVTGDVDKETQDELAASNLTFKQVQKAVGDKARAWYIEQAKKL